MKDEPKAPLYCEYCKQRIPDKDVFDGNYSAHHRNDLTLYLHTNCFVDFIRIIYRM